MEANRRMTTELGLKGFVPAAFATLLEAQMWETGVAADLRGANTLPGISGCCPCTGEHVQSCWAGWGSLSPAGSPVEGEPDPLGMQLGSAPVVQREPKCLCLCASEIPGGMAQGLPRLGEASVIITRVVSM